MGPHENQPVVYAGAPLDQADAAMIMVHGRGASPQDIHGLASVFDLPRFACVAPAAAGGTWYPFSFMSPREKNEPGLSSALSVMESLVVDLIQRGFPSHKIVLLGFSQGACLSSEFSIRHPRRYGGVLALSGGLIGPPGTKWDDVSSPSLSSSEAKDSGQAGPLDGVPVFLGCSDVDPHIPAARVIESEKVFKKLGARVKRKLYSGMGHLVNEDEIGEVKTVLDEVLAAP
jgi:predicted esterase